MHLDLLVRSSRNTLFKTGQLVCEMSLSAAERRGTPVLLSVSVSDDSGNSQPMAALRRSHEIDQHSGFRLVVIIDFHLATNMADYMDVNF